MYPLGPGPGVFMSRTRPLLLSTALCLCPLAPACRAAAPVEDEVVIAHLRRSDPEALSRVRREFAANNPGYDVAFETEVTRLEAAEGARVVFVQDGTGMVAITHPGQPAAFSEVGVGDVLVLRPDEVLESEASLDVVVFRSPVALPDHLPGAIRPDWDPRITDTPGGCATETGAYRRILLTWRNENGPYVYHGLNAHRVRIMDSFTHYHPYVGGFDEFYLVQMAAPGARLLTSAAVAAIESPETVTTEEAAELFEEHPLEVGDLVYLPRGVVHRGVGGVLAQVIAVPGFVPGAEIGVDAQLRTINEHLELQGADAVPLHAGGRVEASSKP